MCTYDVLIPANTQCEVDLVIGPDYTRNPTTLQLVVAFENGGEGQNVTFKPVGAKSLMTLHNWNQSLGTALIEPYPLAQVNDEGVVEMMMGNYLIGQVNRLTLQFWWNDAK
ncbi:hypothetical protein EGJ22_00850 [Pseudomonas sp. p99-361]|nr:hypothetical protein EGJ22_00850 [Pseudomonas sp. p99-361]